MKKIIEDIITANSFGYHSYNDNPAIITTSGTKIWYKNGKKHRVGNPAVIHHFKTKEWYVDGLLHRTDGPAIFSSAISNLWFVDGVEITTDVRKWLYANKISILETFRLTTEQEFLFKLRFL
jgi:hypothetical protein